MKRKTKNGNTFEQEGSIIDFKSKSGSSYEIDMKSLSCTCPDYKFRKAKAGGICKHIQDVLETITGKEPDFKSFIQKENDPIKFIDKFSDEKLEELKRRGEVIERHGKLEVVE